MTSGWWTWIKGASTVRQKGISGILGTGSKNNRPGARWGHSMVMAQYSQKIFLFGGWGYDSNSLGMSEFFDHDRVMTDSNNRQLE